MAYYVHTPYTLHTLISRLLNTVLVVTRMCLVISDKGNVYSGQAQIIFVSCLGLLGKPGVSHNWGKGSTTELQPKAVVLFFEN